MDFSVYGDQIVPRQSRPLVNSCPAIEVLLREPFTGATSSRILLADTGAGARFGPADLILSPRDIEPFAISQTGSAGTSGALQGQYPVFLMELEMPALGIFCSVRVLSVPATHFFPGFDGIACFRFLNSFTYGNFGNPAEFGLELN